MGIPQWQNFLIRETFCYSTVMLSHSSRIFPPECFSYCSETTSSKVIMIICLVGGEGGAGRGGGGCSNLEPTTHPKSPFGFT